MSRTTDGRSLRVRVKKDHRSRRGSARRRAAGAGRPRRSPRRKRAAASLGVELALKVADGWANDTKRIRLVGESRRRTGAVAVPSVQDRIQAARKVSAGCRPAKLARLLAAIGHPQRIAILRELLAGEATHKTLAKVTRLKAGPLYYHIRELRSAGLIGPKVRDLYVMTRRGRRVILASLAMDRLTR